MAKSDKPVRRAVHGEDIEPYVPVAHFELAPVKKHESSEIQLSPIWKTVVAIFVTIVLSQVVVFALLKFWGALHHAGQEPQTPLLAIKPELKDPALQVDEKRFLAQQTEDAHKALTGYGRVEGAEGKVKMPIDDAIAIVAQRGTLPQGPEWSLTPDEKMVGGVILNPEQVKYANTPPSEAHVEDFAKPGTLMTPAVVSPKPAEAPPKPPAAAPAAKPGGQGN